MIKTMNRNIFREHLLKTIEELNPSVTSYKFHITPVMEEGKKYSSKDDFMRLNLLNEKNTKDRLFDLNGYIDFISGLDPLYPIWIEVSPREQQQDSELLIIELKTSMRFRKPSELQHQDTGHPPFILKAS